MFQTAQLFASSQNGNFRLAQRSVVLAAQSDDPAAPSRVIEVITAAYSKPVYKYVRVKWNIAIEDAADLTPDFFTRLLETEFLDSYDSTKGRLRTFLRICADRLFMTQVRVFHRLKPGAGSLYTRHRTAIGLVAAYLRTHSLAASFGFIALAYVAAASLILSLRCPSPLDAWQGSDPLATGRGTPERANAPQKAFS